MVDHSRYTCKITSLANSTPVLIHGFKQGWFYCFIVTSVRVAYLLVPTPTCAGDSEWLMVEKGQMMGSWQVVISQLVDSGVHFITIINHYLPGMIVQSLCSGCIPIDYLVAGFVMFLPMHWSPNINAFGNPRYLLRCVLSLSMGADLPNSSVTCISCWLCPS